MADLTIDIVADPVCPWCYLGYTRLKAAMEHLGDDFRFDIHWLPFELHPEVPAAGVPRSQYLGQKFGSQEKLNEVTHALQNVGIEAGVEFNFSDKDVIPNTKLAHQFIAQASRMSLATPMMTALFYAYFSKGENIGDQDILVRIAKEVGLQEEDIEDALSREAELLVEEKMERLAKLQIQSVPTYIINEKFLVQGAHPPETFAEILTDITKEDGA
ncbi:DSBA-like thioredoxin domain protein [Marinomonas aquimarina]|uniref:DSBA-like thioredoxin domain protein n=1 Tax=Marinomonas aquimarina TaxID=295068 RepID=A0A1A8T3S8_9GAMM|nr:DsbA family oxidoreductase [Marinomonas aquimarina]SBS26085.1 DSBA-like thioredoxin domain protein [Marinomonas aquimarina]